MATIIAILVAVIVDRYAQSLPTGHVLSRLRSSSWLNRYLVKVTNILERIGIKQSYLILLSAVLPICILLLIVKILLGAILGALGAIVFTALTLFYFLGLKPQEGSTTPFIDAHESSFGVLFWFAVFGPTGAFLYWFIVAGLQMPVILEPINENLRHALSVVHVLAAWIPARITGFIFTLMGNFDPGFSAWLNCARNTKMPSNEVLQNCGQASLEGSDAAAGSSLINRAYVAWVVLVVLVCSI